MTKVLLILLFGLLCEAVGVVHLSRGLRRLEGMPKFSVSAVLRVARDIVTNRDVMLGVAFQAVFFFCLSYLMSQRDLSFIWPLTSLSFVTTTIGAQFFLREHVTPMRWLGVAFIVAGAAFITWSEQAKKAEAIVPETRDGAAAR